MKIFISWSGKQSLGAATALRDWLPYIFNSIDPFVSSEDIRRGKRWPAEVSKELDESNFGIVCLTPDNLGAPWLLFEAGALSKSVKKASVFTLLLGGLRIGDVEGPLSHFQHTLFEKEDFFKLVRSINEAQGQAKQDVGRLRKVYDKWWDELEAVIGPLSTINGKPEKKRSIDEMLHEILEVTSYIARNMPESSKRPLEKDAPTEKRTECADDFWQQVISKAGQGSPFLKTLLPETRGVFSNGILTIKFPLDFEDHLELLDNDRNIKLLQQVLSELGCGEGCRILFEQEVRSFPTRKPKPPSLPCN